MLFRNLKSGNIVAATDETSIELCEVGHLRSRRNRPCRRTRARKGGGQAPGRSPPGAETDAPAAEVQED